MKFKKKDKVSKLTLKQRIYITKNISAHMALGFEDWAITLISQMESKLLRR